MFFSIRSLIGGVSNAAKEKLHEMLHLTGHHSDLQESEAVSFKTSASASGVKSLKVGPPKSGSLVFKGGKATNTFFSISFCL